MNTRENATMEEHMEGVKREKDAKKRCGPRGEELPFQVEFFWPSKLLRQTRRCQAGDSPRSSQQSARDARTR